MNLSPDIHGHLQENLPGEGCIVDIGCGDGDLLRSLIKPEYMLYGIDPYITANDEDIHFLHGMAENIQLPDTYSDAVIMQCVFSLCDPSRTIRELYRVLKSDGVLLISDLYSNHEDSYISDSELIRNIYRRERLESFFVHDFRLMKFFDETDALKEMTAQIILDGDDDICTIAGMKELRAKKTRYGL